MSEVELPSQFTHSLKIEDTAKGVRFSVHVYATDSKTALEETFNLYLAARDVAKQQNLEVAPFEINGGGKK